MCSSCYHAVLRDTADCPGCGRRHPLIGLDGEGRRICAGCAGIEANYECRGCGTSGLRIKDGKCYGCLGADQIRGRLAGADGSVPPRFAPLAAALIASGSGEAVYDRYAPGAPGGTLLALIAQSTAAPSHRQLDGFPQTLALHHLRAVLIDAEVLPPREEPLERIVPWLDELLAEQPADQAKLVRTWTHWILLRRARSRAEWRAVTDGTGDRIRTQIRSALALLTWIDDQGLVLDQLDQGHIDLWLTSAAKTRGHIAGPFVTWLRQRGLVGAIAIPDKRQRGNPSLLPDEERWAALRRCLTDEALPDDVRAAGTLVLLYGLTLSRTTRLRTEEIERVDGTTSLNLAGYRLRLEPSAAAVLARQQHAAEQVPRSGGWLFPGRHPGTHVSAAFQHRIASHGLPALSRARAGALITLAAQIPPPVLAQLLGLHVTTAERWARYAQDDWATYLQARLEER